MIRPDQKEQETVIESDDCQRCFNSGIVLTDRNADPKSPVMWRISVKRAAVDAFAARVCGCRWGKFWDDYITGHLKNAPDFIDLEENR